MADDNRKRPPQQPATIPPPGAHQGPPPDPAPIPNADPRDERIAALEERNAETLALLADIQKQLAAGAVNAVDAVQDRKSKVEQQALAAEIDKGTARRTQEACDARYSEGRFRFRCDLPDGNGHPQLVVSAENEVDAKARYLDVCGVRSTETEVQCSRA